MVATFNHTFGYRRPELLGDRLNRWMQRADACPNCSKPTLPRAVLPSDELPPGFIANYTCPCGNTWTTSWGDIDWSVLNG